MPNKTDLVRRCLREGPTTSAEVAASTKLTIKHACARLTNIEKRGEVRRIGRIGRFILFALPQHATRSRGLSADRARLPATAH